MTAGELYGRALMVIAAEQHATPLVVPSSQRMAATRSSEHKGHGGQGAQEARRPAPAHLADEGGASDQARPRRLREGGDRRQRAAPRRGPPRGAGNRRRP